MRRAICLIVIGFLVAATVPALAEFDPAGYKPITQVELAKNPKAHAGKKYQVSDKFQFCGSDFCVQIKKTKINTKDYYCFTIGTLCAIRMYLLKAHSQAEELLGLKKGDGVTVYGTFDYMGMDYQYLVVDRIVTEKAR